MATTAEEILRAFLIPIAFGESSAGFSSKFVQQVRHTLQKADTAVPPFVPAKGNNLLVASHWVLDDALELIRSLQGPAKDLGYHITLGGGVLNKGLSLKDLDLFFLPYEGRKQEGVKLVKWLGDLWGKGSVMGGEKKKPAGSERLVAQRREHPDGSFDYVTVMAPAQDPSYPPSAHYAKKMKFTYSGLRVDIFIVGEGWKEDAKPEEEVSVEQINQEIANRPLHPQLDYMAYIEGGVGAPQMAYLNWQEYFAGTGGAPTPNSPIDNIPVGQQLANDPLAD